MNLDISCCSTMRKNAQVSVLMLSLSACICLLFLYSNFVWLNITPLIKIDIEHSKFFYSNISYPENIFGLTRSKNIFLTRQPWSIGFTSGNFIIKVLVPLTSGDKNSLQDAIAFMGDSKIIYNGRPIAVSSRIILQLLGAKQKNTENKLPLTEQASWKVVIDNSGDSPNKIFYQKQIVTLPGLSWVIFDGYSLKLLFHMFENLLGLWAMTQEHCPNCQVDRIIFLEGSPALTDLNIRYQDGTSTVVGELIKAICPHAEIVHYTDLRDRLLRGKSDTVLRLEQAVASDRSAALINKLSKKLNKMNAGHYQLIAKHLPSLRSHVYKALNISVTLPSRPKGKPAWSDYSSDSISLLAVDRDQRPGFGFRDIDVALKAALMRAITDIKVFRLLGGNEEGYAVMLDEIELIRHQSPTETSRLDVDTTSGKKLFNIRIEILQRLSCRDQVQAFADTTVVLGIHGNGLTNAIWQASHRTGQELLFEIAPPGSMNYDFQLIAEMTGLRHVVYDATLGLLSGSDRLISGAPDACFIPIGGNTAQFFHQLNITDVARNLVIQSIPAQARAAAAADRRCGYFNKPF